VIVISGHSSATTAAAATAMADATSQVRGSLNRSLPHVLRFPTATVSALRVVVRCPPMKSTYRELLVAAHCETGEYKTRAELHVSRPVRGVSVLFSIDSNGLLEEVANP